MKTRTTLLLLGGVGLLAVATAVGLRRHNASRAADTAARAGQQVFTVTGIVRAVDVAAKTVRLTHEEIPGYMPAMTMPFAVSDASLLTGLATNDTVRCRFVVTETDSWIERIEKIAMPADAQTRVPADLSERELDRVQTGERVPDFVLTNQFGQAIRLSDYRGRAVVLTFIYTRCPIPNFCPRLSQNFAELQARLRPEFAGRAQLLSITMDPGFDTPEVLRGYGESHGADFKVWTFATGSRAQTDDAGVLFGLVQETVGGLINHDLRTALIAPDGRLVHLWKSNVWTPYEVQRLVRETLTGNRDVAAQ